MPEPAAQLPAGCPRVVGATDDGKRLQVCGHTNPCPYHGAPTVIFPADLHIVTPAEAEESE